MPSKKYEISWTETRQCEGVFQLDDENGAEDAVELIAEELCSDYYLKPGSEVKAEILEVELCEDQSF